MKSLAVLAFVVACWASTANAGGINVGVSIKAKANPIIDAGKAAFQMVATIVSLCLIPVLGLLWGVMYPLEWLLALVGMLKHNPNEVMTFPWIN